MDIRACELVVRILGLTWWGEALILEDLGVIGLYSLVEGVDSTTAPLGGRCRSWSLALCRPEEWRGLVKRCPLTHRISICGVVKWQDSFSCFFICDILFYRHCDDLLSFFQNKRDREYAAWFPAQLTQCAGSLQLSDAWPETPQWAKVCRPRELCKPWPYLLFGSNSGG